MGMPSFLLDYKIWRTDGETDTLQAENEELNEFKVEVLLDKLLCTSINGTDIRKLDMSVFCDTLAMERLTQNMSCPPLFSYGQDNGFIAL
ncbi:hypothetical protein CY34DRAFT_448047 [Suillus luteus UH-Slu-Lm8-n1]|uniref:Uncharacterized protein n=1 Tax=Suillus luteus UH-Slu-Lm8-n1 TaxID=930992 RepID=A0A0D0AWR5_9AGAM|nr:hypothetical protein CY34DRAFT_448047 [Suillus luteus UH-Slu-Lm8-n1]